MKFKIFKPSKLKGFVNLDSLSRVLMSTEGEIINWDRVSELREEVGDEDFAEVLDMFFDEVEAALGILCGGESGTTAEQLHFLKGSTLNIGFKMVSDLCLECETILRGNPDAEIDSASIGDAFQRSRAAFSGALGN